MLIILLRQNCLVCLVFARRDCLSPLVYCTGCTFYPQLGVIFWKLDQSFSHNDNFFDKYSSFENGVCRNPSCQNTPKHDRYSHHTPHKYYNLN